MKSMKYILAKAYTNSEWDSVDFALIPIEEKDFDFFTSASNDAKELKKKYEKQWFSRLNFSSDEASFFLDTEDSPTWIAQFLEEDKEFTVIELSEDVFNNLSKPEQDLRYGTLKIDEDSIQYVTYGKHTSEEFWIGHIQLKDLIKLYTNEHNTLQPS